MGRDRHSRSIDKRNIRLRKITERQDRDGRKTELSIREQLEQAEQEEKDRRRLINLDEYLDADKEGEFFDE
jgi:hypothetical protein